MKSFLALAALPLVALAKTNLEGCTSSKTVAFGGASMVYWDPTNGEICSFLDCGGGRAPPKTTVPGCPQYEGTATYSPDFLPGWGQAGATSAAASSYSASSAASSSSGSSSAASVTTGSTLITSAATLPSVSATGTGGLGGTTSVGGNNVTGTAHPSPSVPVGTGAANSLAVAQGVVGLMAGAFGLALL